MVCYVIIILTGASSSCSGSSGPIYVRPPGFRYHAQEITRPKIKKKKKERERWECSVVGDCVSDGCMQD